MINHSENDEPVILNLNDEVCDKNLVDIHISSNIITIPFFQLIKYSGFMQQEYCKNEILSIVDSLTNKLQLIQQECNIKVETISIFFKILNEEKIEVSNDQFCDLCKLAEIFQIKPLQKLLNKYLKNHSQNVDLIIKLMLDQLSKNNILSNNHYPENMEEYLHNNVDKCITNHNFGKLPVSTINRIFEKSDMSKISSDILYDFIAESIDDRFILFPFIKLQNLSEKKIDDLILLIQKSQNSSTINYSDYLHIDYEFIKQLKDDMRKTQSQNFILNEKNEQLNDQIKELKLQKVQFQAQIDQLTKENNDIKKLNQQIEQKINKENDINNKLKGLIEQLAKLDIENIENVEFKNKTIHQIFTAIGSSPKEKDFEFFNQEVHNFIDFLKSPKINIIKNIKWFIEVDRIVDDIIHSDDILNFFSSIFELNYFKDMQSSVHLLMRHSHFDRGEKKVEITLDEKNSIRSTLNAHFLYRLLADELLPNICNLDKSFEELLYPKNVKNEYERQICLLKIKESLPKFRPNDLVYLFVEYTDESFYYKHGPLIANINVCQKFLKGLARIMFIDYPTFGDCADRIACCIFKYIFGENKEIPKTHSEYKLQFNNELKKLDKCKTDDKKINEIDKPLMNAVLSTLNISDILDNVNWLYQKVY